MTKADLPVSRRIHAERAILLGWSRAILLQLAHPLVAAGVADHSTFRSGPLAAVRRLHDTVKAMLAVVFGDAEARARAIAGIRAIHDRVHGTLREAVGPFAAGTQYSAHDPSLLLWVHVTLLDSIARAFDEVVAPLSVADRDAYCVESVDFAVALGVRDAEAPRTWAALQSHLAARYESGELVAGPAARTLADSLLHPSFGGLVWPLGPINRLVTRGWLPPSIREQYGLSWTASDARRLPRVLRLLHATRRVLPAFIARWPATDRKP